MTLFVTVVLRTKAQVCEITGRVTIEVSGLPLSDVNIVDLSTGLSVMSDSGGHYSIQIARGRNTQLSVSHIGYRTVRKTVNGHVSRKTLDIQLHPIDTELGTVSVEGQVRRILSLGDTLVLRPPVSNEDATLGDALSKTQGFRYENGILSFNGETISRVMIDGMDFFRGDVGMALDNIPAEMVKGFKTYRKLTDFSQQTGIDDGQSQLIVDVESREGYRNRDFGKAYSGYGNSERYELYGMYNQFRSGYRWSLFAQCNNVNVQNFSIIDLLSQTGTFQSGAPTKSPYARNGEDNTFHPTASDDVTSMMTDVSDDGITVSKAVGTNYNYKSEDGRMKVDTHYLCNTSGNSTDYTIEDEYFGYGNAIFSQKQHIVTHNMNHRFQGKLEYAIGGHDYLIIRPSLYYQGKTENSMLTDVGIDNQLQMIHSLNSKSNTDQDVLNSSDELVYIHRLSAKGQAIAFNGRFSYSKTDEETTLSLAEAIDNSAMSQNTIAGNIQKSYTTMVSFVQPIAECFTIKADAGYHSTSGVIRRATSVLMDDEEVLRMDSILSGTTHSRYGGLLGNISIMYGKGGINATFGGEYHLYDYKIENDLVHHEYDYSTLNPFAIIRYLFNGNQLHLQYQSSQIFPSLLQVHETINNVSAVSAIMGNSRLQPSHRHSVMLRLVIPGIAFSDDIGVCFANLEQTDNYIASGRTALNAATNSGLHAREMLNFHNADGHITVSGLVAYGFPMQPLKSNLNLSSMVRYSRSPGFCGETKVFNRAFTWNSSVTMASDISERVDFILDFNGKLSQNKNLAFTNSYVNYWSLSYGGKLNWALTTNLKAELECGRTSYYGSGTSRFNALICNTSLGWKFLREKRGELKLSCHDIFDMNNNFYEITSETYRREVVSNVLRRYGILTFTYKLDN